MGVEEGRGRRDVGGWRLKLKLKLGEGKGGKEDI